MDTKQQTIRRTNLKKKKKKHDLKHYIFFANWLAINNQKYENMQKTKSVKIRTKSGNLKSESFDLLLGFIIALLGNEASRLQM